MKTFLLLFTIIISLALFKVPGVNAAIECVQGDVQIDTTGDGVMDDCLYGSNIAENKGLGSSITDPRSTIRSIINVSLGFLGVISVIMIMLGGYEWLTARGNEEKVEKGKKTLMWAAIGAIVISIAWTITSYILQINKTII